MWYYFTFISFLISRITAAYVEDIVNEYFKDDNIKTCEQDWNMHRKSFENALTKALQEGSTGSQRMNVYIKSHKNKMLLTKGYYHTDNQVKIVLQDVALLNQPTFDPEVNFPLCSNVLKIESTLSRMTVTASYMLFRNKSSIVYDRIDQDPYMTSPLRFEQVKNQGEVAITVDRCILNGIAIAAMKGHSVNLKYNSFRLSLCQISFEIFNMGSGVPPVIANYLLDGTGGLKLERLIIETLKLELIPLLQGAIYSFVNTTAIFRDKLDQIRERQNKLLEDAQTYISNVVGQINALTKQNEAIRLNDFKVYWNDTFIASEQNAMLSLKNMYVSGLDSAYAAHVGGPYKLTNTKVVEQIRISTLQVVGVVEASAPYEGDFSFAVEINDATIELAINVEGPNTDDPKYKFEVIGWRTLDFSCPDLELLPIESIVTGYLYTELPKYLEKHFNKLIDNAVAANHKDYIKNLNSANNKAFGRTRDTELIAKKIMDTYKSGIEKDRIDIERVNPESKLNQETSKSNKKDLHEPFKKSYYRRNPPTDHKLLMERMKVYERNYDKIVEKYERENLNKNEKQSKNIL